LIQDLIQTSRKEILKGEFKSHKYLLNNHHPLNWHNMKIDTNKNRIFRRLTWGTIYLKKK